MAKVKVMENGKMSEERQMTNDLSHVSIGVALAIGKIRLLPSDAISHHMPMLHFIVLSDGEGGVLATCIQLRVDGYGDTIDECLKDLERNVIDFVRETFKNAPAPEDAYASFYSLMEIDPWAMEWWNAYRKLQMKLSLRGIKTDVFELLEGEIKDLKKKIIDLESAQKIYRFRKEQEFEFSAEIVDLRKIA